MASAYAPVVQSLIDELGPGERGRDPLDAGHRRLLRRVDELGQIDVLVGWWSRSCARRWGCRSW